MIGRPGRLKKEKRWGFCWNYFQFYSIRCLHFIALPLSLSLALFRPPYFMITSVFIAIALSLFNLYLSLSIFMSLSLIFRFFPANSGVDLLLSSQLRRRIESRIFSDATEKSIWKEKLFGVPLRLPGVSFYKKFKKKTKKGFFSSRWYSLQIVMMMMMMALQNITLRYFQRDARIFRLNDTTLENALFLENYCCKPHARTRANNRKGKTEGTKIVSLKGL